MWQRSASAQTCQTDTAAGAVAHASLSFPLLSTVAPWLEEGGEIGQCLVPDENVEIVPGLDAARSSGWKKTAPVTAGSRRRAWLGRLARRKER